MSNKKKKIADLTPDDMVRIAEVGTITRKDAESMASRQAKGVAALATECCFPEVASLCDMDVEIINSIIENALAGYLQELKVEAVRVIRSGELTKRRLS